MNQKLLLIIVAILALSSGFWFSNSTNKVDDAKPSLSVAHPKIQGFVVDPPKFIAMPPLRKDDNSLMVNADLKGHWSLLFFGYTHCPDICPTTMNVLAQTAQLAKERHVTMPKVYFVSVDPQRDSVEMLGEYVRYFDETFVGVTGEPKMIEALTLQAGVVFMQTPSESGNKDDYLVDHSASILLINPQGKLKAYLRPPHSADVILKSLKALL